MTDPVIDVRGASFGYGGRTVVTDIDLQVARGESIALLGPNGCGKSTLVKGLLGLDDHLGGSAYVLGKPIGRPSRHSALGYVPQRHTLSTSVVATVEEIVAIGRLPAKRFATMLTAHDRAIIEGALEVVGLGGMGRHDVTHLSGGQQRRVLVARALASEPEILIMDEPTAGVDESNQHVLARAMIRLAEQGVTLLTVTHEIEALEDAIGRVVAMSGGRIVYDGALADYRGEGNPGGHHLHEHAHHIVGHAHGVRQSMPLPVVRMNPREDGHA